MNLSSTFIREIRKKWRIPLPLISPSSLSVSVTSISDLYKTNEYQQYNIRIYVFLPLQININITKNTSGRSQRWRHYEVYEIDRMRQSYSSNGFFFPYLFENSGYL